MRFSLNWGFCLKYLGDFFGFEKIFFSLLQGFWKFVTNMNHKIHVNKIKLGLDMHKTQQIYYYSPLLNVTFYYFMWRDSFEKQQLKI